MNRKKIIIIAISMFTLILITVLSYFFINYLRVKYAKIEVKLKSDMTLEFNDHKMISDYIESINGKIIKDKKIQTTKLGKTKINFEFINDDNIKVPYSYEVEVVDTVSPVVWLNESYSIALGSRDYLLEKILCGDNYDNNPTCEILGEYDLNKLGVYPVTFSATDSSGNKTLKDFKLRVYEPNNTNYTPNVTKTYFSDVVKKYKTDKTKIGIDVSGFQKDIDFEAIKEAGVEFIIIKVGGTKGTNLNYYVDSRFERNIKLANEYGIDVGIYFFSYASSSKETIEEAKWVLDKIKPYKVNLPIVFDWEDFGDYNSYHMSFYELTKMGEDFIKTVEDAGYKGMIYGSKNYLEKIWLPTNKDIWLAHYTDKTTYEGKYKMWQICDDGVISGIDGSVDIDIMYE